MRESVQPTEAKIRLREAEAGGGSAVKEAVVLREALRPRLEDAMLVVMKWMKTVARTHPSVAGSVEECRRHSDEDACRRRPRARMCRDYDFLDKAECTSRTDEESATASLHFLTSYLNTLSQPSVSRITVCRRIEAEAPYVHFTSRERMARPDSSMTPQPAPHLTPR